MDLSGLVDRFMLWRRFGLPIVLVLMVIAVTLLVVVCQNIPDKLLASGACASVGYCAGVWFAMFAHRHSRP
jgi:hypothetical protein